MLSRPLLQGCKSSKLQVRSASAAAVSSAPSGVKLDTSGKFPVVKFVREDFEQVAREVPNFSYYEMPNDTETLSKYQSCAAPLSEKLVSMPADFNDTPAKFEMKFAQLENGLKICSVDKGGQNTSLGLFVGAGSRYENPTNQGVSHMLEMVAYRSTAHLSHLRTSKMLEALACDAKADANREYISYNANCLREYFPLIAPMMVGNVLYPRLLRWEVASAESKIKEYTQQLKVDLDEMISELLHEAAFHNNTLGRPLYCTEASKNHMDEHTIRAEIMKHYSPCNMCFVGVNVNHDELCKWLMRAFCDYNAVPRNEKERESVEKAVYTGGYRYIDGPEAGNVCHVGIGFYHQGGWNEPSSVAVNVFQTILGATGGLADGVASSRLNKRISEMKIPAEASSFNRSYSDAGLFGVYGAVGNGSSVPEFIEAVVKSCSSPLTTKEVARAKAQLKRQVAMGHGNGEDLVTDIGNQIIMTGTALTTEEICARIDAVTEADVKAVQASLSKAKPTVAAHGSIGYMPHYDTITAMFAKGV